MNGSGRTISGNWNGQNDCVQFESHDIMTLQLLE